MQNKTKNRIIIFVRRIQYNGITETRRENSSESDSYISPLPTHTQCAHTYDWHYVEEIVNKREKKKLTLIDASRVRDLHIKKREYT